MEILSPALENNGQIPSKYTCDGENISPELIFKDVPPQAKSLALICHDPDAPLEGGWTHWVIIDMEPDIEGISEGSKPSSGIETLTSYEKAEYGGPCPPSGTHRYYFYLYALDKKLNLGSSVTKEEVEAAMDTHVIQKTELMAHYHRIK